MYERQQAQKWFEICAFLVSISYWELWSSPVFLAKVFPPPPQELENFFSQITQHFFFSQKNVFVIHVPPTHL